MINIRADRRTVLGVVSLGNFSQIGARLILSPIVPLIVAEFGTTKTSIGLVLTGMWAVYALTQFPSGVLADRYGERRLLIGGLASTVTASALIAVVPVFSLFALSTLLLGLGTGLFFSPAASLLSGLFTEDGKALGTLTAAGAVAGVVYPAGGGVLGGTLGWRYAVGGSALLVLPIIVATVVWTPASTERGSSGNSRRFIDRSRVWEIMARPGIRYSILLAVVFGFVFQAITSFFPTFLQEYHGLETGTAGVAFGGMFALSSLFQPIMGSLSDRTTRALGFASTAAVTGSALLVLLWTQGPTGVVVGTVLLGVGMSWPGVVQASLMDHLAEDQRGFGFGFLRTVYMFFAASGSVVVGSLADIGGWQLGYGVVVALLGSALILLVVGSVSRH